MSARDIGGGGAGSGAGNCGAGCLDDGDAAGERIDHREEGDYHRNDDADPGGDDLSSDGEEWERVRAEFGSLLPRFGTLWRNLRDKNQQVQYEEQEKWQDEDLQPATAAASNQSLEDDDIGCSSISSPEGSSSSASVIASPAQSPGAFSGPAVSSYGGGGATDSHESDEEEHAATIATPVEHSDYQRDRDRCSSSSSSSNIGDEEEEEHEFNWTESQQSQEGTLEDIFATIKIDDTYFTAPVNDEEDEKYNHESSPESCPCPMDADEDASLRNGYDPVDPSALVADDGGGGSDSDDDDASGSTVINFNHISFDLNPIAQGVTDDTGAKPPLCTFDRDESGHSKIENGTNDAEQENSGDKGSSVAANGNFRPPTTIESRNVRRSNANDWQFMSPLPHHQHDHADQGTDVSPLETPALHVLNNIGDETTSVQPSRSSLASSPRSARRIPKHPPAAARLPHSPTQAVSPAAIDLTMMSSDEEDSPQSQAPPQRQQVTKGFSTTTNVHPIVLTLSSSDESSDDGRGIFLRRGFRSACQSPRMDSSLGNDELENSSSEDEFSWRDDDGGIDSSSEEVEKALAEGFHEITILESDGEESHEPSRGDSKVSAKQAVALRPDQRNHRSIKMDFRRNRDALGAAALAEFNDAAFDGKLSSVTLEWSNLLRTTAGRTHAKLLPGNRGTIRVAKIELSTKVITNKSRLRATLLHEMCHAATWIIDENLKPPHGDVFKKWAALAMANVPDVEVTTTHDYEIEYRYAWSCQTPGCGAVIQRQSRSVCVNKHICARCKGRLVEVHVPKNGEANCGNPGPLKQRRKAAPSKYNLFVRENSATVRRRLEAENRGENPGRTVTQQEVMKEIARLWQVQNDAQKST